MNGMSLYSWALSPPGLASAFATLLFGKLSDMYGRRVMLLISLALYGGGAVLPRSARIVFSLPPA